MEGRIDFMRRAVSERLIVTGWYGGLPREFCPHILGTASGRWTVLAWQTGGRSDPPLPADGDWQCLPLDDLRHLSVRLGVWHRGRSLPPGAPTCVAQVDTAVDVGWSAALTPNTAPHLAPLPTAPPPVPVDKVLRRRVVLLRQAIRFHIPVSAHYDDLPRLFCPHLLGRKDGRWQVLAWQFGGEANNSLPPDGGWRCFSIAAMEDLALRHGRWHRGVVSGYGIPTCVDEVDTSTDGRHGPFISRDGSTQA